MRLRSCWRKAIAMTVTDWTEIAGNWVLVPSRPRAVIHFLGGAFVATAPQLSYRSLLEYLAGQGFVIIATPFVNTLDHTAIARQVLASFHRGLNEVRSRYLRQRYLPVYGLGHSMGSKLHLLIGSQFAQERAGNVLISFNNYSFRKAVPLGEQVYQFTSQLSQFASQFVQLAPDLMPNLEVEFTPSPEETNQLITDSYQVPRNLLLKFNNDTIDQTRPLHDILRVRYPEMTAVEILPGNHLTPLGQDVKWQPGAAFTPFDALGQFVNQSVNRDFYNLQTSILRWLDPGAGF